MDSKRKADGEHPQDPERQNGKRKTVEEEEESMLRKTVKYLKMVGREETVKMPQDFCLSCDGGPFNPSVGRLIHGDAAAGG